jgi:serine/threonine protein kinase
MTIDNSSILPTSLTNLSSKDLRSEITYELVPGSDTEGCTVPMLLGRGRFAKVYKAWQCSAGHNVRPVAIKILHENIDRKGELLFHQEIRMMKKLTSSSGINVINILDILQLGPMAMCGNCGQIYHPRCPQCGVHPLERYDAPHEAYSSLRCKNHPRCKYTVSGEHILNGSLVLMQSPSKVCCANERSDRAQRGTLINFVDRDAVVMELMEEKLPQFRQRRQRAYFDVCCQHGVLLPPPFSDHLRPAAPDAKTVTPPLRPATSDEVEFVQKVVLLEKTLLMVQLAEAVAWLHGAQEIVHKDLAPDNIMITALASEEESESGADWRGLSVGSLSEALTSLATYQSFKATVIDFGLSDQKLLSRNWYEEPVSNFATEKLSYLSLEARHRKRRLYQRLDLDPGRRQFLIPDSLRPDKAGELAIKVGDLLVDESDPSHYFTMEVTHVEQDATDRRVFRATVAGEIPPNSVGRQFDLVMRLGEAHDIYSLAAVFYFILTGDHTDVSKLTNIANLLQDAPLPLRADVLSARVPNYRICREQLPEQFYQDELMVLILRAMVRGQEDSFVESRTQRGPDPARQLLAETRRIYNQLKAELLTTPQAQELASMRSSHHALSRLHGALKDAHAVQSKQLEQMAASHAALEGRLAASANSNRLRQWLLLSLVAVGGMIGVGVGTFIHNNRLLPALPSLSVLLPLPSVIAGR